VQIWSNDGKAGTLYFCLKKIEQVKKESDEAKAVGNHHLMSTCRLTLHDLTTVALLNIVEWLIQYRAVKQQITRGINRIVTPTSALPPPPRRRRIRKLDRSGRHGFARIPSISHRV
jgi:hypothetical protein